MTYEKYLEAEREINEGLIRLGVSLERPEGYARDPEARMREMRSFLAACGDPQRDLPAVHVAGTSGKGSVCSAVAAILSESGLRVGLHVSPYLQSATEKIWVDGRFVAAEDFHELVEWVLPVARPRVRPETPASIHGMASVAIALEGFRRENVDAIVFEAGCGARYDLTSFVDTRVAVITNVGLDHVVSLGPGLDRIAWHKAGVARPGVPLVSGATDRVPAEVIRDEARLVGAELIEVAPDGGAWQHNERIAVTAARAMAGELGVEIEQSTIERGLERAGLAGRRELMPPIDGEPLVVLDGAHNAAKLEVAVNSALSLATAGPRVAVVGFLGTKAGPDPIRPLAGRFDRVIATEPRVYAKSAYPVAEVAKLLEGAGLEAAIEPEPRAALEAGIAAADGRGLVLATGSFYLVGDLRERWFPKRSVVLERTSYPSEDSGATLSK
jgi:dihydrofolate synthase/folylpolyglutamate synthase